jgi:hypothetical protein
MFAPNLGIAPRIFSSGMKRKLLQLYNFVKCNNNKEKKNKENQEKKKISSHHKKTLLPMLLKKQLEN